MVRLPAFTWEIEELTYDKDFWYYFFREFNNPEFHKIAKKKKATAVWEALQMLDSAQWTEEELNACAQAEKAVALRQKQISPEVELARRDAYRVGVERGREQAEEDDDDDKDRMRGVMEAHRMYFEGERDIKRIVKATGLAPYEIKDIIAQEERNDKQSFWRNYFEGKEAREKARKKEIAEAR